MKKERMEEWGKTREKGLVRFVIVHGLLGWGLPMFVVMAFLNNPFTNGFTSKQAIVHCVLWPIAGIAFGLITWWFSEFSYRKAKARESIS